MPPWTLLSRRRKSVQVTPQAGNSGSGDGGGDLNARAPVTGGFPEAAPRLPDGTSFIGGETEQRRHAKQTGDADGDDDSKSARRVSRTAASNGTRRDRLGLFRSRSTHFDLGSSGAGSEGGELAGGSSGIARRSTIASLYFPQASLAATTTTPPSSASPETPAATTAHRGARVGSPDEGRVKIGTGTGAETGRKTPQTGPAVIGESVKQAGGRLQRRLKRLPSLTLRRGLSWRGSRLSKAPPAGVGKPGTVLSQPSPPNSTPRDSSVHSRQALRSPVNSNKPLPPTPASESQLGGSADDLNNINTTTTTTSITTNPRTTTPPTTASNPPVTLLRINRIMATLSALDIEKLFSGAPQYFARSEGHFTGAPHPSVAFPWDEELAIRDLTDHTQIEDEAWGCITAWPHITRDVRRGPSQSATREVAKRRRAHFYPRCRERPSMLSMQGLEKGTIGYQAALELGVADALQEEQWGFGSLGAKDRVVVDARKYLIASKDGLRRLEETAVLDHLIKNAQRYQETHQKDKASCHELFNELFSQILHQPAKTFTDPFSLSTQIQSLLKVLATPNVWIDFSHVEWRIRLGQILWGTADDDSDDSVSDGASITEAENSQGMHEERYWLLLQILLACELIIRLDTLTEGDEISDSIKPSEIQRFERTANSSVKWSLHLARAWLENIEVTKTKQSTDGEEEQPKGWLANLTHRMSLTHERPHSRHHERHHDHHKQNYVYVMKGKYWERQVHGLTHFAKRLKWPDIESQSRLITDNCRAVTDGTPITTPLETPLSTLTGKSKSSSYFASRKDITLGKKQERRQKVGAALHPAGWLSKSYISGLMLPGEGLYHFLMSTLLENDVVAMSKLGPVANLCGGFVYSGKSFWSTACIVGRVLAAGKGAVECMGWISSDVTPRALQDGWVDIDVEDIPEDVKKTGKQSRIWGKLAIERESSILGGSDPHSIFPADFIIPYENHYKTPPPTLSVELRSLELTEPLDSVTTTPTVEVSSAPSEISAIPAIKTFTPAMTFNVTTWENDDDREYTIPISKDVYFVTAHPCMPSQHVRILKSPSSPTIQQIDLTGHPVPGPGKSNGHAKITCHPLHKFYTYTPIHLSELLTKSTWTLDQLLQDVSSEVSPSITPSSNNTRTPRVLVIDAITNFVPQPEAHEIPLSPITSRTSTNMSDISISSRQSSISSVASPDTESGFPGLQRVDTDRTGGSGGGNGGAAEQQMHSESRRRQFGSDMEILVRALCAEKGWNALISRRRRGCLACAIREAGAIGWRVVIRVD